MNALFVDGHNFLFKSYSVPYEFRSKKGTQLQVVSTFLALLRRSIRATNSEALTVAFDSDVATDNHELLDSYKSNRNYDYSAVEMSPFAHLPLIKRALDLCSIPWIEEPKVEADDVIATLSTKHLSGDESHFSYIASSDTDFLQLIDDRCKILKLLPSSKHVLVDSLYVMERFKVTPKQYPILKSWVGDQADNIKGITGIGWKRGAEIINGTRSRELTDDERLVYERNLKLIHLNCAVNIEQKLSNPHMLFERNNNDIFVACDF